MFITCNANPAGNSTGDCVIRAISIITGKSWREVYHDLYEYGMTYYEMIDTNALWHNYLYDLGFDIFAIPKPTMTVREFCKWFPKGMYILGTGKHVIPVIDGDYYDTWDSGFEIPVFYWRKEN